jgi:hypothetical protein
MENLMKKSIIFIPILVSLVGLLLSCATTRLEDFKPKSTQEKEVLEVFTEMIEARKNQDFDEYMEFFNDNAKIFKRLHPGSNSGSFIPKQQYAESPGEEFGIQLNPTYVRIKTGEDLAILDCWNQYRAVKSHLKLDMEKEEGEWRVIKYDYTPYRR